MDFNPYRIRKHRSTRAESELDEWEGKGGVYSRRLVLGSSVESNPAIFYEPVTTSLPYEVTELHGVQIGEGIAVMLDDERLIVFEVGRLS